MENINTNNTSIALAILIIGFAWLYLSEIRPSNIKKECAEENKISKISTTANSRRDVSDYLTCLHEKGELYINADSLIGR